MKCSGRKHNETPAREAYEQNSWKDSYCLDLGLYGNTKGTWSTITGAHLWFPKKSCRYLNSSCLRERGQFHKTEEGWEDQEENEDQIPHPNPLGTICTHWHLNFRVPQSRGEEAQKISSRNGSLMNWKRTIQHLVNTKETLEKNIEVGGYCWNVRNRWLLLIQHKYQYILWLFEKHNLIFIYCEVNQNEIFQGPY